MNHDNFTRLSSFLSASSHQDPTVSRSGDVEAREVLENIRRILTLSGSSQCPCCGDVHGPRHDVRDSRIWGQPQRRDPQEQIPNSVAEGRGLSSLTPSFAQSSTNRFRSGNDRDEHSGLPRDFRVFYNTVPKTHLVSECLRLGYSSPTFDYSVGGNGLGPWTAQIRLPFGDEDVYVGRGVSKSAAEEAALKKIFSKFQIFPQTS